MTTNMDRFKQALEARNNAQTSDRPYQFLKLEKGSEINLRFLPIPEWNNDTNLPFIFKNRHYVDQKWHDCLGSGCPFCKAASDAWNKFKKSQDEADKDEFKRLVKTEYFTLIGIDTEDADSPLYIFSTANNGIKETLLNMINKNKDFVDQISGRIATIKKADDQFGKISLTFDDPEAVSDTIWSAWIQKRDLVDIQKVL